MTAVDDTAENRVTATTAVPTFHGGLANLDDEHSYWIDEVEGAVPADLEGTFLRNGPGRQRIGDTPCGHWFDGDGMISAFSFRGGRVHFRNRYVRTPKYVKEAASERIEYRGFGTMIPGGWRKNFLRLQANPANTNTIVHGGHVLALYEGGHPFELDPASLATRGEFDYDGGLSRAATFSAHPKVHVRTGDMVNFGPGVMGVGRRGPKMCMNLFRVDASGRLVDRARLPVDVFPFAHDMALSDRYALVFVNSILFEGMGRVFLGTTSIADQVRFAHDRPMQIAVVDLDTLTEVRRFETEPGAIIHVGNAYEDGDEVVVDGMWAGDFAANDALSDVFHTERLGGGSFRRYRLNLRTGAMSFEQPSDTECEFPTINPAVAGRANDWTYTACSVDNGANSFFNGFQKVGIDGVEELVTLPPGHFGSEPLYAPATERRGEDAGYVLEVVYNAVDHVSELHVFRAADIGDRLARLTLRHHLPHQFHGFWHDQVLLADARR